MHITNVYAVAEELLLERLTLTLVRYGYSRGKPTEREAVELVANLAAQVGCNETSCCQARCARSSHSGRGKSLKKLGDMAGPRFLSVRARLLLILPVCCHGFAQW